MGLSTGNTENLNLPRPPVAHLCLQPHDTMAEKRVFKVALPSVLLLQCGRQWEEATWAAVLGREDQRRQEARKLAGRAVS